MLLPDIRNNVPRCPGAGIGPCRVGADNLSGTYRVSGPLIVLTRPAQLITFTSSLRRKGQQNKTEFRYVRLRRHMSSLMRIRAGLGTDVRDGLV